MRHYTRAIDDDKESLDLSSLGSGYKDIVKCVADFMVLNSLVNILPKEKYFPLKKNRGFDKVFYDDSDFKTLEKNIITVYSTVGAIDSTEYFGYNEEYLKHLFSLNIDYQTKEYKINDKLKLDNTNKSAADSIRKGIIEAGFIIKNTIEMLEQKNDSLSNIKFLVVIEGQASKVRFHESDWENNYTLSYLRAQYLNEFWKDNGIDINSIPRCELIISGSGEGGVPRIIPNEDSLHVVYPNIVDYIQHWLEEESKNQRFLIHIVPVIGNIDGTLEKIKELKKEP